MGNLQTKVEKEVDRFFQTYTKDIIYQINLLADAFEFILAFKLGKKFRQICTQIGEDPRFKLMIDFKSTVRNADRDVEQLMQKVKLRAEINPTQRGDSDTPIEKFEALYMRFYREIDIYLSELYQEANKPKESKEAFLSPVADAIAKTKDWIKNKLGPELTSEELKQIEEFRKTLSENDKLEINKPIPVKDELDLFLNYAKVIEQDLNEYEQKGWFNSIRVYVQAYLSYLEKIAEYHNTPDRYDIQYIVQAEYNKIKSWFARVETKYANSPQLPVDPGLLNENMKTKIMKYKIDRKLLRQFIENTRILALIKNKTKS